MSLPHTASRTTSTTQSTPSRAFALAALAWLLVVLVGGCNRAAAPADQIAASSPEVSAEVSAEVPDQSAAQPHAQPEMQVELPSSAQVIMDLYPNATDTDYDGRYTLRDGRTAWYWFGHEFPVGERRYAVAFVAVDPTAVRGDAMASGPLAIAVSTYVLTDHHWQQSSKAMDIGRFGADGEAPTRVEGARVTSTLTGDGRYVMAVPTWSLEGGGIETHAVQTFVFDADAKTWRTLGSLYTGENDDAGCIAGKTVSGAPCSSNTGALHFETTASALPDIVVVRSGTVMDSNGAVRHLGDADTIRYVYASDAAGYVESGRRP